MSQMEAVPDIVNEPVASYGLTAETLYEKCIALARNLWWSWNPEVINLFRDLDPIRWRQLDHNPIALLSEFTAERLEMRASELVLFSRVNQAYRRLKEYMAEMPAWGAHAYRRVGLPAGRLFLAGVRRPRVGARLFGRPGGPLGRSHQKRQRPGRAADRHGPVLRPGLFQAALGHQRLPAGGVSRHEGRESAHGAGPRPRRQADHGADRDPHGQVAGQGVVDAGGAGEVVPVGLRRADQQPGRPRVDGPALRRRQPHADPPGVGGRHRRGAGADGLGNHAGRVSPQRRASAPLPPWRPSASA